ncbi:MAG: DNA polymerase III subunit delta' [Clostridiales bacterium]|jgi:DNA polymerase-3 subunit delta'|nr:DNA polymerase III subunit delta' [Clostridiales bacterium]
MSIKIYSNQNTLNTLKSMLESNRLAHSFLLYGDVGVGKKTIAKYYAMSLMCENYQDNPCQKCITCKNILNDTHPDVIWVEHSGKLQGFSAETVRNICTDAFIKPNSADKKIYIFADADNITIQAQNALLKLVEEPPDFTYFIFTAKDKNVFLPTIISRIISLGVSECVEAECRQALEERGFLSDEIDDAISCFHGNIGLCISYIQDEKLRETVKLTKSITDAIINRNEYELAVAFAGLENDRNMAKTALTLLDKQFHDVLIAKFADRFIGCYPSGSKRLSQKITTSACEELHLLVRNAISQIDSNVNLKLILSALCGEIIDAT